MSFIGDIFDFFTGGESEEFENRQRQSRESQQQGEETRSEVSGQSEESQSVRNFEQSERTNRELTQFRDFLQNLVETGSRELESTTRGTQVQAGQQTALPEETRQLLQSLLPQLTSGLAAGATGELTAATAERALGTPDEINQIVELAKAGATREFEARTLPQLSALKSNVGASGKTNTLVNLVESRAKADLAGTLAGVESQIRLEGLDIANETARTAAGLSATAGDTLSQIANVLKGSEIQTAQQAEAETATSETELTNLLREITGSETLKALETIDTDITGQETVVAQRNSALQSIVDLISQTGITEDTNLFGSGSGSTSGSFPKLLSGLGAAFGGARN